MKFRIATKEDLLQLKEVYKKIIKQMYQNQIEIWDEVYPCEFFEEDIENESLYILEENTEIVAAFALCDSNAGAELVEWEKKPARALYMDRFGVNVKYTRQGIGSIMLKKAMEAAKEKGANCLRLFVVDCNQPAINLYIKNGFIKAAGSYDEIIDEDLTLHEYGFEADLEGEHGRYI